VAKVKETVYWESLEFTRNGQGSCSMTLTRPNGSAYTYDFLTRAEAQQVLAAWLKHEEWSR